jgi:hypothetical protein
MKLKYFGKYKMWRVIDNYCVYWNKSMVKCIQLALLKRGFPVEAINEITLNDLNFIKEVHND